MGPPYIGVTGVDSFSQLRCVEDLYRRLPFVGQHELMIGLLWSAAAVHQPTTTRPGVFSTRSALESIVSAQHVPRHDSIIQPRTNCVIHVSGWHDAGLLEEALQYLARLSGQVAGVQINSVRWPEPRALAHYRQEANRRSGQVPWLILQVTPPMMNGQSIEDLISQIEAYDQDAKPSHVMLNWSFSRGDPLDVYRCMNYLDELTAALPECRFAVSGRLSAEVMLELLPLFARHAVGVDAEQGLRVSDGQRLDFDRVAGYLQACSLLLQGGHE